MYERSLIRWKKCERIGIIHAKKCKTRNRQLNSGKVSNIVAKPIDTIYNFVFRKYDELRAKIYFASCSY